MHVKNSALSKVHPSDSRFYRSYLATLKVTGNWEQSKKICLYSQTTKFCPVKGQPSCGKPVFLFFIHTFFQYYWYVNVSMPQLFLWIGYNIWFPYMNFCKILEWCQKNGSMRDLFGLSPWSSNNLKSYNSTKNSVFNAQTCLRDLWVNGNELGR